MRRLTSTSLFLLGFVVWLLVSCRDELPLPPEESPVFYINMSSDGNLKSIKAGIDDWYMDADMFLGDDQVRVFSGAFRNFNQQNTESLEFLLRDVASVALQTSLSTNSLAIGEKFYVGELDPSKPQRKFKFRASSRGKMPFSYEWDFGDGNTSTVAEPVHEYLNDGEYQVNLSLKDGRGCWAFAREEVNAGESYVECRLDIGIAYQADGTVKLTANLSEETEAPSSLIWSLGDGNSVENQSEVVHQYKNQGIYEVKLAAHFQDKTCTIIRKLYSHSGPSCVTFMEYGLEDAASAFGRAIIKYTDGNGIMYTSSPFKGQPAQSSFLVKEVEDYEANQFGSPTKKIRLEFEALLYNVNNESDVIKIENGEAVIAVEVPQ
ncbi:MAG: PKD domain-containing protein [Bacteroidia bacterium]|nr:PKD domain-containing protein [Bacteroidia bacterium]